MRISEIIENIIKDYMPVRNLTEENKYKLKNIVEKDLVEELCKLIKDPNLKIEGHTRVGKWADIPWIRIGDKRINSKPQTGIYIAILFKPDGSGIALTVQHGTDKMKIDEIKSAVKLLRSDEKLESCEFLNNDLNIRQSEGILGFKLSPRAKKYEIANIAGKIYSKEEIGFIHEDLLSITKLYSEWVDSKINPHKVNN